MVYAVVEPMEGEEFRIVTVTIDSQKVKDSMLDEYGIATINEEEITTITLNDLDSQPSSTEDLVYVVTTSAGSDYYIYYASGNAEDSQEAARTVASLNGNAYRTQWENGKSIKSWSYNSGGAEFDN